MLWGKKMSRRDVILVSVFINVAFLGLLFFIANWGEREEVVEKKVEPTTYVIKPPEPELIVSNEEPTRDEIDQIIKNYTVQEEEVKPVQEPVKLEPVKVEPIKKPSTVEVTVKRGDSLDKISRANGTTVKAIMQANQLSSARIDVGQVLRIPLGQNKEIVSLELAPKISSQEAEYYTLKSGDNPWKVAKQFKVRFDQLLDLNGLDEEKARNLKPGDTLRVK
jgi:LysM repeat protein